METPTQPVNSPRRPRNQDKTVKVIGLITWIIKLIAQAVQESKARKAAEQSNEEGV